MKNFSNKYIFIYSIVLVAVVAVLLSVVAMGLKDRQDANVRNEKMQTLLAAINVETNRDGAAALYKEYFVQEVTVGTNGDIISIYDVKEGTMVQGDENMRAFVINLKEQQLKEKTGEQGAFPVYIFNKDGRQGYVIPTQGNGLWGPVYANIALDQDLNTIIGVTFSHDSETPGLGAEICTPKFQKPFIGKQILDENGEVVSVSVKKHADHEGMHEVDAISGGTMTSNGVSAMLSDDLKRYQAYITNTLKAQEITAEATENMIEEEQINEKEVENEQ